MEVRTLVATFGFDEARVLPALRLLPYDRLVLLAGKASLRTEGFRRLKALEPALRAAVVDPFDFVACFRAACAAFQDALRDGATRASVSGGTKVMADAAVVAAFQEGVEAWYYGPEAVRLPVLRGVRIVDALGPADRVLARLLRRPVASEELLRAACSQGVTRGAAVHALNALQRHGLAAQTLAGGRVLVRPTAALVVYRAHLAREETGKA